MKEIVFIVGTRPEIIKVAPIIYELKKRDINFIIINTGQHKEMSHQMFQFFKISPDFDLNVMSQDQTLVGTQIKIMEGLDRILKYKNNISILVQGDTLTAYCGAMYAFLKKIDLYHVEAGLRTNDLCEPFPEEGFRQLISRVANINFVVSDISYNNLIKENIQPNKIVISGNTVIDSLKLINKRLNSSNINKIADRSIDYTKKLVLVTVHRRENHGKNLVSILKAIRELALYNDINIILPVHPNPNVKTQIYQELSDVNNIVLTQPLDYLELLYCMKNSSLVISDSGGIQEEATFFNVPLLILRNKTERSEVINYGYAKLVGSDSLIIVQEACNCLNSQKNPLWYSKCKPFPFGDGSASRIIVDTIVENSV